MVSEHASPLAALGGVDSGGQNVHVAALATAIGARGHQVFVHTRREEPQAPREVALAARVAVDHVDAGPPRSLPKDELRPYMGRFADELRARWARDPPDLVHAHFWMSGLASLRAARPLGVPVVQTFHALGTVKRRHQGASDTSPAGRLADERMLVREVDEIVATCADEVFELLRLGGERGRITVIPCGVDLERFRPDGPAAQRRPGFHRLVAAGRLVKRKGMDDIVAAVARLPATELVIAGGLAASELGSDLDARRLLSLARDLGVADRLRLTGRVDRDGMPPLLRSADIVVCAPWYEPFGVVPLEAMACGVPVVASATGGLVDSVVDGVTGAHVPPREPERLADALAGLLDQPARRRELGAAGASRARVRYGWGRIADATLEVYARLLGASAEDLSRQARALA